ncbi:sensor histidine kinase [Promicromonospora citrea]|uniref:histidine kinase n=1 Tax=Promicromonospora citrea TaxID=43677 RepID=A0A8H9GEI6_9MICO|nr:ATP-binding protein [Promicromonospora citrea]NNH50887.1 HAMP domain-containing protein [Promicromonospora citrea]GGM15036.1 two-component sensor histidine kinase [Promicromonospora citrea]
MIRPHVPRPRVPDVRPLDPLSSLKIKLGVLVAATVTAAVLITWLGLQASLGPSRTFPLAIILSLLVTQVLARGMTSPLREITEAVQAMADGDYTRRVRATSRDEVGQLAHAFNRMAEDLASVEQTRRDLIANVSHELRTPVAALQAQLENMVDGVVQPTPAALEQAHAQTERLTRLVTYLLDLSRIEAGASALNVSTIAVGDFLEHCAEDLSMVDAAKDLHYVVDVTPEDLTIEGDAERLHQVVTNLLQNAIRHSPAGGVVRLDAYPVDGSESADVVLEVSDEGPGIAEEDRERIFQRFVRGTGSTGETRGRGAPGDGGDTAGSTVGSSGGTGIGLAIVRWAVELHGGYVEVVDSERGATMRVTLPARAHPAAGVTTTRSV